METSVYTRPLCKLAILDVRREGNEGTLDADDIRITKGSVVSNDPDIQNAHPVSSRI